MTLTPASLERIADFAVRHIERGGRLIDFEVIAARPLPSNPFKKIVR